MEPKILFVGPLKDFSGYASASRNYVNALKSIGCDIVTRHLNYDGANYKYSEQESATEARGLQDVNIVVQQTTPNETEHKLGLFNVNIFCWETDRIPAEWVMQLNLMDLVIVACKENLFACRSSGVVVPMEVVPFAFNPKKYERDVHPFNFENASKIFKILTVCQISKKKGMDVLLRAYFSEFGQDEDTLLILKLYHGPNDTEEHKKASEAQVVKIRELMRLPNYPKVWLIHNVMTEEGIERLYKTADTYVLPSRGEGWSITHFEAMANGVPPIATNWGGPTEFITEKEGWLVDCHMSPCFDMPHPHSFMYTARDNWPEPHIDDLRKAMRHAYQEWKIDKIKPYNSTWKKRIENCKKRVHDFSYEEVGPKLKKAIIKHYDNWKTNNGH